MRESEIVFAGEPNPYGRYCFLEVLVVHKNYRRRGVGTELVRCCLEYAKNLGHKFLDTMPEDERSKRLYLKFGFRKMFDLYKMRIKCEKRRSTLPLKEASF